MPMLVIEGIYRILGARPDGDSVRFYPNDVDDWDRVDGPHRVQRNAAGGAQLRLDAIDALETHFLTTAGELHQPPRFARAAASELLDWLGFADVARDSHGMVTGCEPVQVPGYIMTRTADVYGRCVAFAGKGAPPTLSGSRVFVDIAMLQRTVNHHQLSRGLAYPTFYRKLYPDLRGALAAVVESARAEGLGLWPSDLTQIGAKVDTLMVLPKLFRRLADYLALNDGDLSLAGFVSFLGQRDDRLFVLSTGHSTGLDTIVQVVDDDTVKLTVLPENIVFDER
jgi:endonuclease YncB( thermonuclease family)